MKAARFIPTVLAPLTATTTLAGAAAQGSSDHPPVRDGLKAWGG